jgi:acyl-CoA reductase-like NAD-dependent aldehyde dehydrogenase
MAQRLRARMEALHVGDPLEPATDLGPVVSSAAREGALEAIRAAASDGASVFEWTGELPARGYFLRATLLGGARPQDPVPGPAIALSTFATLADAVSLAGEGGSGASATVWTDDGGLALRAARALRAASVGWNGRSRLDPSAPFGGFARAGFGRQGGLRGLLEYLQP